MSLLRSLRIFFARLYRHGAPTELSGDPEITNFNLKTRSFFRHVPILRRDHQHLGAERLHAPRRLVTEASAVIILECEDM